MLAELGAAAVGAAGSFFSGKQSADYAKESYQHRYRWMVKDLQKAGLNPMLAVQQSPGSPPQPTFENIGEGAVKGYSAAAAAKLLQEQLHTQRAMSQKTLAEAEAQNMDNVIKRAGGDYQDALKGYDHERGVQLAGPKAAERFDAQLATIKSQAESAASAAGLAKIQNDLAAGNLTLQQVTTRYADQLQQLEVRYRTAMAQAAEAGVPEATAAAKFWEEAGVAGRFLQFLKQIFGGVRYVP